MATSELSSDSFAFPCRDDGSSTALSPPVVISVLASILERHIARNERALAAAGTGSDRNAASGHDGAAGVGDSAAAAEEETRRRVRAFDGSTELDMSLRAFVERFSYIVGKGWRGSPDVAAAWKDASSGGRGGPGGQVAPEGSRTESSLYR